jgi:hypothetical protein
MKVLDNSRLAYTSGGYLYDIYKNQRVFIKQWYCQVSLKMFKII